MAKPDIMLLEKMRVRQRPIVVYGDVIKRLIRCVVPTSMLGALRRPDPPPGKGKAVQLPQPPAATDCAAIPLDDLFLGSPCNRSLDLFAIATKE